MGCKRCRSERLSKEHSVPFGVTVPRQEALKGNLSLTHWFSCAEWCRRRGLVGVIMSLPFGSVQFNSVAQLCPTLYIPMDCSTPGLPVHHQLPKLIQTHVHRVGDAVQSSHPLSSPSPPTFNLAQHQGLFQ